MEINGAFYCSRCMRRMEEEGKCPHCGYDSEKQERNLTVLEEGTLLAEKYQLGAVIGQGGFGITYAAWDENLDRPVAVKEYFPDSCVTRNIDVSDEVVCLEKYQTLFLEGRLRFERESRLLASLQEIPNVVKVLDYFSENNTAYIVMEYIHGAPLDAWIKEQRMKPAQVLQSLRPVADALVLLHKQGIVHRDLKPDNLLVEADGAIRLIDFGAAMQVAQHGETIILSRGYAPVEQYGKEYGRQGPWSDVYSLAAVIYELLTGVSPQEALLRLQRDELKSPAALGVKLHKKQSAALMAALAVQPEKRTQSMEEFRAELYMLPMPEQVLWRKRMQRRMISAFAVILLLAAVIAANFTTGLPLGHGLLYTLQQDGWHILREWRKESHRELPGSLLGLPVTQVERDAFREDEILEQVTLPPSVQSVGDQAFYGCPKLNTVYLNEGLQEIGLNAFDGAAEDLLIWGRRNGVQEVYAQSNHLRFVDGSEMDFMPTEDGLRLTRLDSSTEILVIPSYVNGEPVVEFSEDVRIHFGRVVYFPENLKEIPDFLCCFSDELSGIDSDLVTKGNEVLEEVYIGNSTVSIGRYAFSHCSNLKKVVLGKAISAIDDEAFSYCFQLNEILWGNSLERIGENAFSECDALTEIRLPDTVTHIGVGAFYGCDQLSSITLSQKIQAIPALAFTECIRLSDIFLHEGITEIGSYAFDKTALEFIILPESLEWLDEACFSSCLSLQYVHCLGDHSQINQASFPNCTALRAIGGKKGTYTEQSILDTCSYLGIRFEDILSWTDGFDLRGETAYYQSLNVETVRVPWINTAENCVIRATEKEAESYADIGAVELILPLFQEEIHDSEFAGFTGWKNLKKASAQGTVRILADSGFAYCNQLSEVAFMDDIELIGAGAFCGTAVRTVSLKNAVSIGENAFSGCEALTEINLGSHLRYLGEYAFNNTGLTGIRIPGTLRRVLRGTFEYGGLHWMIAEEGVLTLEDGAFRNNVIKLENTVFSSTVEYAAKELLEGSGDCWIFNLEMTFPDSVSLNTNTLILHGYPGSTTETFAREYGFVFEEITASYEETVEAVRLRVEKNE